MGIKKIGRFSLSGHIELTYRCNLNCLHCYCKGLEDTNKELSGADWKKILEEIRDEGCLYLTLSGGEPLVRDDFLALYAYAKKRGFIITIFSNGQLLNGRLLAYLTKSPPHSIEITLNGITKETHESITQVDGSFARVMENIKKIKENKLPLIIKSNCLRQNKDELARIKLFADELLGRNNKRFHFKYDPLIYPRLNLDKEPTRSRLSFKELLHIRKQDKDIWRQFQKRLHTDLPDPERNNVFLYRCNSWRKIFFINPFGRLKFCNLSDKFSVNLKSTSFKKGFYEVFPGLLKERFKTDSKCRDCRLRPLCYHCPARAYLETGNEESPVSYYCELAKETAKLRNEKSSLP
jgi:radical SAM protein with 4Fe4S-binding SPASM domain